MHLLVCLRQRSAQGHVRDYGAVLQSPPAPRLSAAAQRQDPRRPLGGSPPPRRALRPPRPRGLRAPGPPRSAALGSAAPRRSCRWRSSSGRSTSAAAAAARASSRGARCAELGHVRGWGSCGYVGRHSLRQTSSRLIVCCGHSFARSRVVCPCCHPEGRPYRVQRDTNALAHTIPWQSECKAWPYKAGDPLAVPRQALAHRAPRCSIGPCGKRRGQRTCKADAASGVQTGGYGTLPTATATDRNPVWTGSGGQRLAAWSMGASLTLCWRSSGG